MSIQKCLTKYRNYLNDQNGNEVVAVVDRAVDKGKGRKKREVSEKMSEMNEVEQLVSDMVPVTRNSDVVQKLEMKRKIRHELLLKKLADDINELNLKIEENVTISSEEVKAHIKNDRDHLAELLRSLNVPEVASYHESVFFDMQKKADEMKSHQLRRIHDLYGELNKMENLRAEENEKIFRSTFTNFEKNAHMSSYEVQYFAEHEALKMNQISLNNRRCFEDLKLKLVLGCEHTFKSFMDEVFCIREKWLRYNAQQVLDIRETDAVTVLPEPNMRTELKGHELSLQLTPDKCYNTVDQKEWFSNVEDVMRTVGNYKMGIDELFVKITQAICKNMSNECDDVRRAITSLDVLQFEVRWIQPISFGIFGETWDNFVECEKFWQDCLKNVENTVKDVENFLLNFGELWANHNRRLCESKILVLKALDKAEEINRLLLQDLEAKLNLNLDLLRQESNEQKIEILYNSVKSSLDAIRDRLESSYVHETSIAEEFYKMMDLEAGVLSSDIKEFICTKFCCSSNKVDESENQSAPDIADTIFGALIQDFTSAMESLNFEKSEMIKDLERFSNNAKERLTRRAEEWCQNKVREISMKHQIQLEMHTKRYERVRIQTYEVRLEEIRVHKQVYDEHKAGVEDTRKTLNREIENLFDRSVENLERCKLKAMSVADGLKKEEKAEVVKYVQSQMIREKSDFINDFKSRLDLIRGEVELKITSLQKSNLKFMKSIKLFHENGNYDADEAKTYVEALENIDKEVSSEGKNIIKDVNKKESHITQKATEVFDAAIRTLSQLYEELKFHSDVKYLIKLYNIDFEDIETNLKSDFVFLLEEYDRLLTRYSDENTYLSGELDDAWVILIHSVCKNISNIFYKHEPPEWEVNKDGASTGENNSYKVYIEYSKADDEKWTKPPPKVDGSMKDFAGELFETSLFNKNDSSFVNRTCCIILRYMGQIEALGSIFYKMSTNKSLIRKDLIQANYEDFMQNVYQTFRLFAAQSEQVWLKTVERFLPLLSQIKTSFKTYAERRVREHSEKVAAALDNYKLNFTKCFIENECGFFNAFQSFDNRLLPLHGCPRNKTLLESLQEEVVQQTAELELNWESFIKKHKNELKHFRMLYTIKYSEWDKLKKFYSYGENVLFSDVLGQDILNYMYEIIEKRGFVKKLEKIGRKDAGLSVSNPRDVQNFVYLNEILLHNDVCLSDIKQIIDEETADDTDKFLLNIEFRPGIKLIQALVDFDIFARPYVAEMDNRYREVKELINSKSDFHKEIIFDWLDKWKMNVAKITDLYSVKYAHTEEQSENSSECSKYKASPVWLQKTIQTQTKSELNEKEKSISNISLGSVSPSKRQSHIPVLSRSSPKPRGDRKKAASVSTISPKTVVISNGKTGQSRRSNKLVSTQSRSPSPLATKSNKNRTADKVIGRSRSYGSRSLISNTADRTGTKGGCTFEAGISQGKKLSANNINFNKSCTTITLCSPRADSDTPTSEILTPHSKGNASSYTTEDLSPSDVKDVCVSASISKTSFDYDYNVESCNNSVCQQPHCSGEYSKMCDSNNVSEDEPQLELLDLSLKDSESQLFSTVPGSAASSARKTASDESLKLDDLQTPKTTIRTISGEELVFSSSMEFDIENDLKNNDLPNESEDTIKELLEKTEDDSFVKAYSGIHLCEDDAYEYDSGGTTDADVPSKGNYLNSEIDLGNSQDSPSRSRQSESGMAESLESKVNWRSRENELLTDVHYRQSLYHPAVLRRKSREGYKDDKLRWKSIEDGCSFRMGDDSEGERDEMSEMSCFEKDALQDFASENINIAPLRTRRDNTPEEEDREMFDRLNMMRNSEYVFKEIKRERTKRERITGAVLKITAKFIHLLAILNLWPGDNCQLLTSHTLRYGR